MRAVVARVKTIESSILLRNGGKTLALAANGAFVTAHDVDQRRMKHLEANAKRAKVSHLITTVSDANELKKNGYYYDSVLVDAPCSSVGAWRRTPSSRWLAKEEDVQMFSKLQLEILFEAASIQFENRKRLATKKTTKTTTLVYATCSIFREENEDIARAFEASDIFMEMGYEPWPFKRRRRRRRRRRNLTRIFDTKVAPARSSCFRTFTKRMVLYLSLENNRIERCRKM